MQRFRHLFASRKLRIAAALALIAAAALFARDFGLLPRGLPEAGVLVVDLRNRLPDKAGQTADGLRSVSAVDVLRALDAARSDRRIAGLYLRVGGDGLALAQALETADAVLRLRRAGKFAVVYAEDFTAANHSDRVLAASADEVWTAAGAAATAIGPDDAADALAPGLPALPDGTRAALWNNLLTQAARHISAASASANASSVNAVARPGQLPPPQFRRGEEAQAEQSALAWGGADAAFVDLLTWREALDRRLADAPVIAVIQAEGILAAGEGAGPRDLAAPLAARMRAAAQDRRVRGIILRISAVAAPEDALAKIFGTAEAVRRAGLPVGVSFGPVVPVSAAALRGGEIPLYAAEGALLVEASGAQAAELAEWMRAPWRNAPASARPGAFPAAEAPFIESRAAVAAVAARAAGAPNEGVNNLSGEVQPAKLWRNGAGSLLDLRDRLMGAQAGRALPLYVYEPGPTVLERTNVRLLGLWRQMRAWGRDLAALLSPPASERGGG